MIILTVKRNLTWSVPGKKSLKIKRRDSSATLQQRLSIDPGASVQNTKVTREPILITEKWRRINFPRFARTDRRYAPLCRCLLQPAPPTSNIFRRLCIVKCSPSSKIIHWNSLTWFAGISNLFYFIFFFFYFYFLTVYQCLCDKGNKSSPCNYVLFFFFSYICILCMHAYNLYM